VFRKIVFINLLLFSFQLNSFSQITATLPPVNKEEPLVRCATDQRVKMLFKKFPERKMMAERLSALPPNKSLRAPKRLQNVVYLPVVFHIVLPNPYEVSDEVVQSQIDAMNTDYAGLNPDTTNLPAAFLALRGHSNIRFVLAKRTPSGKLTNGIERVFSNTKGNPDNVLDSIKRKSLGGADAWDPNSYINIWVGNVSGGNVLGYTQIPGSGNAIDDGVFCNILGFGISSCNVSQYNKGRTVVHELGHYFGINHIWGDDENSSNTCGGDDFRALTADGSSFTLPASLYNPPGKGNTADDIGDTPNQSIASSGCLSGIKTDSCTPVAPGIMYENFMDYTSDDCYNMFTKKQVERMEYVLTNYESGLLTSLGGQMPSNPVNIDASPVASVNPGGYEVSGCSSVYYPNIISCEGNFVPKVLIKNNGFATLTSITVGYVLNSGTPVTKAFSVNLKSGATQVITLPSITVASGTNVFKFFTSKPNGTSTTDEVPSNDTLLATLTVPSSVSLPISEGFESSTFPPQGWFIINPNNDVTWQKTTPGSNSGHSIFIDNYNGNSAGAIDDIQLPKINLANADPVIITFDLAHKNYPDKAYNDSLQVLVSTDCGATFKAYFNKAGASLSTAGSSSDGYTSPAPSDWKNQKIVIDGASLSSHSLIIKFRNISDYGNNIFIDNINIKQETSRDLTVVSVNPPASTECEKPVTPVATIKNVGFSPITSFKVSYQLNNGAVATTSVTGVSLAPDATMTVPLNVFTPPGGQQSIKVYTSDPVSSSGSGDESPLNDTLRKSFFVTGKISLPVTEGFESSTFPPAGWSVENTEGDITWQRTTSAAKTGTASAFINNFNAASYGTTDKLVSGLVPGSSDFDSIYVSFDYAYSAGPSSSQADTLMMLVTTDCGQTFTTVWKKYGTDLQTVSGYQPNFVPSANGWQNVKLNLFSAVGHNDFQVYFVFKGNKQNNLFGITVPARLKQQGYLIYPNPFHQQFVIRNYEVPVTLQSARIYNSIGQQVWARDYYGKAYTEMNIDFSTPPPGVYILKLFYTDKTVVQKIVKQ
jgi:hypothetical protein